MQVLIVGAGAVGQVYGCHLARGGATVSFFVKPQHAEAARRGFTLHPVRGRGPTAALTFTPQDVLTSADDVRARRWDQVWLCVPAPAIREPSFDPVIDAVGEAPVIDLTPGLGDRAALLTRFPRLRCVAGVVGIVAWRTPLPGQASPGPGTAFWLPPLTASLFDGPETLAPDIEALVHTLRRGGCPAARRRGAEAMGATASALMLPVLAALESEGWSLRDLIRGRRLAPAMAAAREALRVVDDVHGTNSAFLRLVARPWPAQFGLGLAPRLVPFDFEAYLRAHFTKVGAQTRAMLAEYVRRGEAAGLPAAHIEALLAAGPPPGKSS
jgi:2-dehydropantoate 2-reductase